MKQKLYQSVLNQILIQFTRTTGKVDTTPGVQPRLAIETDHGKANEIGQFALRHFPCVETYFACHEFRKARLSVYFKQ